jgi:hypothetical protein
MEKLSQDQVAQILSSARLPSRKPLRANEQMRLMRAQARAEQRSAIEKLRSSFPETVLQGFEQACADYRSAFRKLLNGQNLETRSDDAHRKMVERGIAARDLVQKKIEYMNTETYIPLPVADIYWSSGLNVWSSDNQPWHNYVDFTPGKEGAWGTEDQYVTFAFHWPDPGPGMVVSNIAGALTCDGAMYAYAAAGGFYAENYAELQATARLIPIVQLGGSVSPQPSLENVQIVDAVASVSGFFQSQNEDVKDLNSQTYIVQYEGLTIPPDSYGTYWLLVVLDLNSYNSFENINDASTGALGHNFQGPFHVDSPFVLLDVTYSELQLPP